MKPNEPLTKADLDATADRICDRIDQLGGMMAQTHRIMRFTGVLLGLLAVVTTAVCFGLFTSGL